MEVARAASVAHGEYLIEVFLHCGVEGARFLKVSIAEFVVEGEGSGWFIASVMGCRPWRIQRLGRERTHPISSHT
eukprot:2720073-Ditylum_brightwellii.AAC.1